MASSLKNLSKYDLSKFTEFEDLKIGIVTAEWNDFFTFKLLDGATETLLKHGVLEENIFCIQVPGAFELPSGAKILASANKLDAIICLGCVIKGETDHNEYINHSVAIALQQLSLASSIPCIFGVLTTNSLKEAKERSGGKYGNKGVEAAATALQMASIGREYRNKSQNPIRF